jgi:hypothetical protein
MLRKLILISILLANVGVPLWGAAEPDARRALKKTLFVLATFDVAFLLALLLVYPRL